MADRSHARPALILLGLLAGLVLAWILSLALGSRPIPLHELWSILRGDGDAMTRQVVSSRWPRTLLGLAVGAMLGVAGLLMQTLTRNPLGDPGLLGVNAGAAAAVVVGTSLWGSGKEVLLALVGAAATTLLVSLMSWNSEGIVPLRVVLAGAALTAALTAVVQGIALRNAGAFDAYRAWAVGSLPAGILDPASLGLGAIGLVVAMALSRRLNALALGDELASSLGQNPMASRIAGLVAASVLCAAATAMAGPIGFLGLAVPHLARFLVGTDHRWLLPVTALLSPLVLLLADVGGRLVARPEELPVGVVTAFLGAPVLLALVRRAGRR